MLKAIGDYKLCVWLTKASQLTIRSSVALGNYRSLQDNVCLIVLAGHSRINSGSLCEEENRVAVEVYDNFLTLS